MKSLNKLYRRYNKLKAKRAGVVQAFVVSKEAMKQNRITPCQRDLIRKWLGPSVEEMDAEIRNLKGKISVKLGEIHASYNI